jgi:transposase
MFPELTARMARSSSPKGNLAMRIREELGEVYADARFAAAFGVRGRPGISPGQLMMASVLQFPGNLTDRQAAEAVRDRITWEYALGLELEDPGCWEFESSLDEIKTHQRGRGGALRSKSPEMIRQEI